MELQAADGTGRVREADPLDGAKLCIPYVPGRKAPPKLADALLFLGSE